MKRLLAKSVIAGAVASSLILGITPAYAVDNVNNLETVISDMTEKNDEVFAYHGEVGQRFYGPGTIAMGSDPKGSHAPGYFTDALMRDNFKDDDNWNALIPWLEIFTHTSNQAHNTSVEMSNIKLYVLRKSTNEWVELNNTAIGGAEFPKHGASGDHKDANLRRLGENMVVVQPTDPNRMFHGWGDEVDPRELPDSFDTSDIKAVFATTNARLVKTDENGADDRDASQFHLQMGTDYYPEKGTRTKHPDMLMRDENGQPMVDSEGNPTGTYFPGVGVARAKRITNDWQAFNFITIWDEEGRIGLEDRRGPSIQERAISIEELRKNPPPLN